MSELSQPTRVTRRRFLWQGIAGASVLGVMGGLAVRAVRSRQGAEDRAPNPFAYEMGHFEQTDASLIAYERVAGFRCPRPDPRRLTFDARGRLCLAAGNYVSLLDTAGATLSEIALPGPARALAAASDGTLYVGLRQQILAFDAQGQRRATWDPPPGKPWLTGLAVSETDLFAADAGNRVIHRYDRSGKPLGRIGERNADRNVAGFVLPSPFLDVELHPDGLLRVNNPGRHRVEAYTVDGHFELAWGKATAAIEGFCGCCNPINLAVLPDGRCVTCEKGLPRVKVYDLHGEFESVVAGVEAFPENAKAGAGDGMTDGVKAGLDAAVDATGRIYVLDMVTGDVHVMANKPGQALAG
ncbi:MAG: hypothetical protein FJ387_18140 [Verrucomicrobia bacterium]|nr:hypothetical protein [Verrucomicrobiota bacterium]